MLWSGGIRCSVPWLEQSGFQFNRLSKFNSSRVNVCEQAYSMQDLDPWSLLQNPPVAVLFCSFVGHCSIEVAMPAKSQQSWLEFEACRFPLWRLFVAGDCPS